MEGTGFRDRIRDFEQKNVQILGISFDTVAENAAFADKFSFPFPLLCDTSREVGLLYGACDSIQDEYAKRITYVIDPRGNIKEVYEKVSAAKHSEELLRRF
ncbi:MAG: peroxiredoxin [Acidobacteriota bacterium]